MNVVLLRRRFAMLLCTKCKKDKTIKFELLSSKGISCAYTTDNNICNTFRSILFAINSEIKYQ